MYAFCLIAEEMPSPLLAVKGEIVIFADIKIQ